MFDLTKPFDINWELNNICNLMCPQCVRNEIKNGNFREDLFHRLNVFNISLAPLSRRIEDIPLLIDYKMINKLSFTWLSRGFG